MDNSRKSNRDDREETVQHKSRQEAQSAGAVIKDKLSQLLTIIDQFQFERAPDRDIPQT
jgi:hypothetical protein